MEYDSLLSHNAENIKVEISLREPLLEEARSLDARTILRNPSTDEQFISPLKLTSISRRECYAEKFRAALTRKDPAIRDYFDLHYAVTRLSLNPDEVTLIGLVRKKLAVGRNRVYPLDSNRISALADQLEPQLKPVVRNGDYERFDLDLSIDIVQKMLKKTAP